MQGDSRILSRVDADAAALVATALQEDGVEIRLDARASRVTSSALMLEDGSELPFDRLLIATGRRANVAGLEPLGLTLSRRGIEVDEHMRAAENVWALGDVTGIAPFTHVGKYHARIAAYDLAGREARADHRAVPATIFTDPQVATVGDTEGGLSSTWDLGSVPRLSTYERPKHAGFVKVVADPERRVLKGAVAVGPEAGEWLQQLTLAIRAETPIEVLLDVIQPYPTFSEGVFLALRELNLDLRNHRATSGEPRAGDARGGDRRRAAGARRRRRTTTRSRDSPAAARCSSRAACRSTRPSTPTSPRTSCRRSRGRSRRASPDRDARGSAGRRCRPHRR